MADACIDARRLEALRASMSAPHFARLLVLFAADLSARLCFLDHARDPLDRARLAIEAHQIRGTVASLGAEALSAAMLGLEDLAGFAAPRVIGAAIDRAMVIAARTQAELDILTRS